VSNKLPARGRRTQAESEQTRRRILDRAERLFADKGYRGVSVREISAACGVRPFTLQHHFGSKLDLYREVFFRWDDEVLRRVSAALAVGGDLADLVGSVVDELFGFFLSKRDWVAVAARAALGEGLPPGVVPEDLGWVRFMQTTMRRRRVPGQRLDPRLLLITVEGVLNNHVLSPARYHAFFGRDVTDPRLNARTRNHLKQVILSLVGPEPAVRARRRARTAKPARRRAARG
jgi:AcrR family transcriptional regulator